MVLGPYFVMSIDNNTVLYIYIYIYKQYLFNSCLCEINLNFEFDRNYFEIKRFSRSQPFGVNSQHDHSHHI